MGRDPLEPLVDALRVSALFRAARAARGDGGRTLALGPTPCRPLTGDEIARLSANGNTADDWGRVRVSPGFLPDPVRTSDFRFNGAVAGPDGVADPSGVVRSTLADAVVGHRAAVRDAGRRAAVLGCGRVVCDFVRGTQARAARWV